MVDVDIAGIDATKPTVTVAHDPTALDQTTIVRITLGEEPAAHPTIPHRSVFDRNDIVFFPPSQTTATLGALSGSGTSYSIPVTINGTKAVPFLFAMEIRPDAYVDAAGNGNARTGFDLRVVANSAVPTLALAEAADSGVSSTDGITNAADLSFEVGNVVAGATVKVSATKAADDPDTVVSKTRRFPPTPLLPRSISTAPVTTTAILAMMPPPMTTPAC